MDWKTYRSDDYGFSMLIPSGAEPVGKDLGGGWGHVQVNVGSGIEIHAVGQLGSAASPDEIEAFAIDFTGIPANEWTKKDEGKGKNGWTWFRTYEARQGSSLFYVVLGTGPRGNYLAGVKTSVADFAASGALYLEWYGSLSVF